MGLSDFDKYQKECGKTAVYPDIGKNFVYPTLGLMGESGEVCEKIKKVIRDDQGKVSPEKKEEIKKELGDILWYLSQLSKELGLKLSEVAEGNLEKLASRKERGKLQGDGDNR
jgi:NTP pyrophosphatase (non-canonical NTP hydrolase)